jgi:hypothetical protein
MSRRRILAGLSALTVAPAVALAASAAQDPDAALIRACARCLELEALMDDRSHPEAHLDCDRMTCWPEYRAMAAVVENTVPQTPAGRSALARYVLSCDAARDMDWSDGAALAIAHTILVQIAGGAA